MIERCSECGANLAMVGRSHRCVPKSDGGVEGHADISSGIADSDGPPTRDGRIVKGSGIKLGPSETKPKRGRPRLGEQRPKPWLNCVPPMSKTTWYRRQKEAAFNTKKG